MAKEDLKNPVGRPPKVIESIANKIEAEFLRADPRKELPQERQLAEHYDVSRTTIRGSLQRLQDNRRLIRKNRKLYGLWSFDDFWRKHKGSQFGVAFGKMKSPFRDGMVADIINGMLDELDSLDTGQNLMLGAKDWRHLVNETAADYFKRDVIAGIFLLGLHLDEAVKSLQSLQRIMISIDHDASGDGLESICFDNEDAGAKLADRLHLLGHRRIVGVFETTDKPEEKKDQAWMQRRKGFVKKLAELKGCECRELEVKARSDFSLLKDPLNELMKLPKGERPSAICVPSTGCWQWISEWAKENSISIPEDVTVVGYCSGNECSELTAYRFDGTVLGAQGIQLMIQRLLEEKPVVENPEVKLIKGRYLAAKTHSHCST